ncbi:MAG TPA: hypothetical protein P5200_03100 [Tenuifilaceae bacterium]|nr:hypothetical protein [Tenuifilaceae bacterium]HRX67331.1 hypothetical protein [Tenuifilaceae bacterium]
MEIGVIKGMVSNSTWIDSEKKTTFKFAENNELTINGNSNMRYNMREENDQIVMQLGRSQFYVVEYVTDFMLNIYNEKERYVIMPD